MLPKFAEYIVAAASAVASCAGQRVCLLPRRPTRTYERAEALKVLLFSTAHQLIQPKQMEAGSCSNNSQVESFVTSQELGAVFIHTMGR